MHRNNSFGLLCSYGCTWSSANKLKGSVKEPNKSTTMKLRKSLVKPVTWQNISSCLVLPPEIVMHNAFNVFL